MSLARISISSFRNWPDFNRKVKCFIGFLLSVALFVFLSASAGAGVVAADFFFFRI